MTTHAILRGLLAVKINLNPQEILNQISEQQSLVKDINQKNNIETKKYYEKSLAQQFIFTKTPTKPRDHSARHDASRQCAGSRRHK